MISFDLKCGKGHVFEAWFRDGNRGREAARRPQGRLPGLRQRQGAEGAHGAAHRQGAAQKRSRAGEQAPEAPVAEGGALMSKEMAAKAAEIRRELGELRSKIEANCDYVGGRFAEEARKIHYGETEARGIYGETSDKEARELHEEGVEFAKIPWLPRHDS